MTTHTEEKTQCRACGEVCSVSDSLFHRCKWDSDENPKKYGRNIRNIEELGELAPAKIIASSIIQLTRVVQDVHTTLEEIKRALIEKDTPTQ